MLNKFQKRRLKELIKAIWGYTLFFWYKLIKKKILQDRVIHHNCNIWYINIINGDCGITTPQIIVKKNWYGKVISERKGIVKKAGHYYYKALNDKNGQRKGQKILNSFYV